MPFVSEKAFEQHIRELIKKHILPKDKTLIILDNKKAVDILLCRNGNRAELFFIEIKYHKLSHGRLGTGHGKGGGIQPEILSKQPTYFQDNMRWILGVEDREGYYFVDNATLTDKYLSGNGIETKYNNIKTIIFKDEQNLTEKQLIKSLKDWLLI